MPWFMVAISEDDDATAVFGPFATEAEGFLWWNEQSAKIDWDVKVDEDEDTWAPPFDAYSVEPVELIFKDEFVIPEKYRKKEKT